jgi:hypothetical protein
MLLSESNIKILIWCLYIMVIFSKILLKKVANIRGRNASEAFGALVFLGAMF